MHTILEKGVGFCTQCPMFVLLPRTMLLPQGVHLRCSKHPPPGSVGRGFEQRPHRPCFPACAHTHLCAHRRAEGSYARQGNSTTCTTSAATRTVAATPVLWYHHPCLESSLSKKAVPLLHRLCIICTRFPCSMHPSLPQHAMPRNAAMRLFKEYGTLHHMPSTTGLHTSTNTQTE
jgi:hypothetical protein